MDPAGEERWRLEGYMPKDEFRAWLEMGVARLDVMAKRWSAAEEKFAHVAEAYADPSYVPEALYWRNVSRYSGTHDATPLREVAAELQQRFPLSVWTKRASVWASE